jgi:xylulokinase
MKPDAYLGIDIGGSGAKAAVFDGAGQLLGFAQNTRVPVTTPEGFTEIPMEEIYAAAREAARTAITESGVRIRALSVASQGQAFVTLDANDRHLHNMILWYDSRAAAQAERLREALQATDEVALPRIETIAAAPKILWLREHYPDLMAQARRYLLLPDYLCYRLTGQAITDPSMAGSTALYAHGFGYVPEALAAAEIDEDQLARVQEPGTPASVVTHAAAQEWGLEPDTLFVTGTNDQWAGALGAGNNRPGIVSEASGTCLAAATLTEKLPDSIPPGMLHGRFSIPRYFGALAYAKTAGAVLEWFRREFAPDSSLRELDELAAAVPVGCNGVSMIPHFEGAVSPAPNPAARGAFAYLTLGHTRADMYRAILEALTFSLRENLEFLSDYGMKLARIRSIGGGAKSDLWLQMKADVTGLPVDRPAFTEAAVMGAAMLAAAGAGAFPSVEESVGAFYHTARVFAPRADEQARYDTPYRRYRKLYQSLYS